MYELRTGAVGFRLASLPLLLSVSTTALKVLNVDKTLPNDSRNNKTLNNKTKTQGESFLFLFLSKNGIEDVFCLFSYILLWIPVKSNELPQSLHHTWAKEPW